MPVPAVRCCAVEALIRPVFSTTQSTTFRRKLYWETDRQTGSRCTTSPAAYTRVRSFPRWITKTIGEDLGSQESPKRRLRATSLCEKLSWRGTRAPRPPGEVTPLAEHFAATGESRVMHQDMAPFGRPHFCRSHGAPDSSRARCKPSPLVDNGNTAAWPRWQPSPSAATRPGYLPPPGCGEVGLEQLL